MPSTTIEHQDDLDEVVGMGRVPTLLHPALDMDVQTRPA